MHMNISKKLSASVLVSTAALLVLAIVPANAISGSSGEQGLTDSNSTKPQLTPEQLEAKRKALEAKSNELEARRKEAEAKANELRQRQDDKSTNHADRAKRCESRKHGINTKISKISANAQRAQNRIDKLFAKAQAYQAANVPNPSEGYASLVNTAIGSQNASAASIATLKSTTPSVECNKTTVAGDVLAFKTAAQDTRTKLKAYRAAARAVLVSLDIPRSANSSEIRSGTEGTN